MPNKNATCRQLVHEYLRQRGYRLRRNGGAVASYVAAKADSAGGYMPVTGYVKRGERFVFGQRIRAMRAHPP